MKRKNICFLTPTVLLKMTTRQLITCLFALSTILTSYVHGAKIGLCIMATGKYIQFVDPLVESARKYFCPHHQVTFFVYTDQPLHEEPDIVRIEQKRLGWPFDTMMRNSVYYQNRSHLEGQDYLYGIDADMLFVNPIGDEILGERVASLHAWYVGKRGTYETNPASLACVYPGEGVHYFAGGFFGGSKQEFFNLTYETTRRINDDLTRNLVAIWHDESHWNRYCIDFKPTVILGLSYCCPQSWWDGNSKIIALDKNHEAFRSP